jgi:hypothetical protein
VGKLFLSTARAFLPPTYQTRSVMWLGRTCFAKSMKRFTCELLIFIKDSHDTTITKVFPIKLTQPRGGAVVDSVVLFL